MLKDVPNRHMIHFPRHHASGFEIQKSVMGQTLVKKEKTSVQDFYNVVATIGGFILAWSAIGLAAFALVKHYIG